MILLYAILEFELCAAFSRARFLTAPAVHRPGGAIAVWVRSP